MKGKYEYSAAYEGTSTTANNGEIETQTLRVQYSYEPEEYSSTDVLVFIEFTSSYTVRVLYCTVLYCTVQYSTRTRSLRAEDLPTVLYSYSYSNGEPKGRVKGQPSGQPKAERLL